MEKPLFLDRLPIKLNVEIIEYRQGGVIPQKVWRKKNVVVNVGREQIGLMLATGISNQITEIAWGDGGHDVGDPSQYTPASLTDTALVNEIFRKAITSVTAPSQTSVRFTGLLESSDIVGQGISEMGLFHDAGEMFARLAFPLIYKGPVPLEFRWTIEI